jgi:hypothetical protein
MGAGIGDKGFSNQNNVCINLNQVFSSQSQLFLVEILFFIKLIKY